jgi:hypothetical protein
MVGFYLKARWFHPIARFRQRRFWKRLDAGRGVIKYYGHKGPYFDDSSPTAEASTLTREDLMEVIRNIQELEH